MLIYIYLFLLIISLFITIRSIYQLITFHRVFQKKRSKAQLKAQKKQKSFHLHTKSFQIKLMIRVILGAAIGLALFVNYATQMDITIDRDHDLNMLVGPAISDSNYVIVEEKIQTFIDNTKPLTLVIGYIDGEDQYLLSYGKIGVKEGELNQDSVYEIGSISKAITGLMLAQSIDDGLISITDTVEDHIDYTFDENSVVPTITLQDLVTHTSGLNPLPTSNKFIFELVTSFAFGGNPYRGMTEEEMLKSMNRTRSLNPPSWEYSNYGAGILGMCLTAAHQISYEELLQELIVELLGLTNTSTVRDHDAMYVDGYQDVLRLGRLTLAIKTTPWLLADGIVSAGGVRSSGSDMLKLLNGLINHDIENSEAAMTPLYQINDSVGIGMFWITNELESGESVTWHNGSTGGYSSFIGMNEHEQGIFILTNQTKDLTAIGIDILGSTFN